MILDYKMGGASSKYAEPQHKKQENSVFFLKQMISTHKAFSITDEYDLQQKIGEGTYAVVYRGRSKRSNKTCAIKSVDKTKAKGISVIL